MKRTLCAAILGLSLGLAACTDPSDPGQRALGGAAIGAGGGAILGGSVGGPQGAVAGAVLGGATGAVVGAVTTPPRPQPPAYYQPAPAPQ